ncbi:hypothetical protein [Cellulosimicrobium sp. CUA-896]|uniref:beta-xylosidase family glycoside hydrolase n=1 Tax=Cellulosimicrobium sp. CUA-896 TaxID=1517881 RepID=UPI001C9E9D4B|nr:hypothetical protein [Cellulosimicrobium sp. CUA-896]
MWPTQAAELHRDNNSASVLLRDAPQEDFLVETRLTFDGTRGNQQAGLVLYENDDRYLKLAHTVLPLNRKGGQFLHVTEFGKEAERPTTTPPTAVANGPMFGAAPAATTWLRLYAQIDEANDEYDVRMASSTDGEHWQWGGTWSLSVRGDLRIGLVSMNATGATAEFDYLRTYAMPDDAATGPALDVTVQPRCLAGRAYVAVRATNAEEVPVDVELVTPYGSRSVADVAPGSSAYQAFTVREGAAPSGSVTVRGTATLAGDELTSSSEHGFDGLDCG